MSKPFLRFENKHASELLELLDRGDLSVAQNISYSGFNYVTYFIKYFNDARSCTPLRYKNQLISKLFNQE